ncbi:MAG TPA: Hsp20/alpha crystallin family protein [Tepidisphaeraceae bacterium]|nr:Hsp20/alpha crystallin family protein [Tepidisphaeraceae bacterium]
MALPTRVHRGFVDPFDAVSREFDHALSRWFGGREPNGNGGGQMMVGAYGVDIREDNDHLYVEADLPGFKKDEVDITLENQTLSITAEKKEEATDQPQGDWLLNERRYARFMRSFTLPPTVDDQKVDAKLADGVLRITLNKREETKPRKITVG